MPSSVMIDITRAAGRAPSKLTWAYLVLHLDTNPGWSAKCFQTRQTGVSSSAFNYRDGESRFFNGG
jgi:hypothetical protein